MYDFSWYCWKTINVRNVTVSCLYTQFRLRFSMDCLNPVVYRLVYDRKESIGHGAARKCRVILANATVSGHVETGCFDNRTFFFLRSVRTSDRIAASAASRRYVNSISENRTKLLGFGRVRSSTPRTWMRTRDVTSQRRRLLLRYGTFRIIYRHWYFFFFFFFVSPPTPGHFFLFRVHAASASSTSWSPHTTHCSTYLRVRFFFFRDGSRTLCPQCTSVHIICIIYLFTSTSTDRIVRRRNSRRPRVNGRPLPSYNRNRVWKRIGN